MATRLTNDFLMKTKVGATKSVRIVVNTNSTMMHSDGFIFNGSTSTCISGFSPNNTEHNGFCFLC